MLMDRGCTVAGDSALQAINAVLSLSFLHAYADAVMLFDNQQLLDIFTGGTAGKAWQVRARRWSRRVSSKIVHQADGSSTSASRLPAISLHLHSGNKHDGSSFCVKQPARCRPCALVCIIAHT